MPEHLAAKVSVGLPVYNGERFLEACIQSILDQTFDRFELIITDNASTDGTEEICRSFASVDSRIRYERLERNIGAAGNFNHAFGLASGEYFKWQAHDDVCRPEFLELCASVLDEYPDVVLSYPRAQIIDADGNRIRDYDNPLQQADDVLAHRRFADMLRGVNACFEIFGLIRRQALLGTRLIGPFTGSDRSLLAEIALIGKLQEVPEVLFLSRDHPGRSVKIDLHSRTTWFDTSQTGRVSMPYWRGIVLESLRSIRRVQVPFGTKVRCCGHVARTMLRKRRVLGGDLKRLVWRGTSR